ncbi:NKAP domain containing 1 [Plectropomus leopardus]|uniref:NKAP domain containing 1 n=1 Tax=Plectropomus leopardus TaxID=160734 RepID=UPI001C4AC1EA|nr:NKAP domain containing 1 [Plectropomus leopardus]XP_042342671.1 NKAP domain containing 1 [Plectropomus leopardus]
MSKQPLGKTLLRNVIRHTDAHNKIQEEMEMWKMRDWEVHGAHRKHLSDAKSLSGQMHCDRVSNQPRERVSEHDDRGARYWSRKLDEFEANDPDRWGHSGFRELYPEEFESDSEKNSARKKIGRHKRKKFKSDTEASLSKRSKKSSRKKKKKKKKKDEGEKRKKAEFSSSNSSSDESNATKDKQQRKRIKSPHKSKKIAKARGRHEDSSSEDSDDEGERERRTQRRKKRKQDSHKDSDSGPNSKKKTRKNWKAAGEESSDDSSRA